MRSDSHRLNRTHGWNETSSKSRGFIKESVRSGIPDNFMQQSICGTTKATIRLKSYTNLGLFPYISLDFREHCLTVLVNYRVHFLDNVEVCLVVRVLDATPAPGNRTQLSGRKSSTHAAENTTFQNYAKCINRKTKLTSIFPSHYSRLSVKYSAA